MIELLRTYNAADIAFIKAIFEGAALDYHISGENFNAIEPLAQPVTFYVPEFEKARAIELLKDMDIQFLGLSNT